MGTPLWKRIGFIRSIIKRSNANYWHIRLSNLKARGVLKKDYPEAWNYLNDMISKSISTGCHESEYLELYLKLMERKPKLVVECGSGISTCVIASALKKLKEETGEDHRCISMEQGAQYHENVQKIFPDDLKPFVEFRLSEVEKETFGPYEGTYYSNGPTTGVDFMFVDGPVIPKAAGHFDSDYIRRVCESDEPIYAILQARKNTAEVFKSLLPEGWIDLPTGGNLTHYCASKQGFRHPEA